MKNSDFKISFTRGSGPGGQHKNKVETCVTIIHVPTGISERCQDTRSKQKNLEIAKERILKKIDEEQQRLIQQKKNELRKERIQTEKVVRTYNFNRNEVYDHRSKTKANLKQILNGDLDALI